MTAWQGVRYDGQFDGRPVDLVPDTPALRAALGDPSNYTPPAKVSLLAEREEAATVAWQLALLRDEER